ncbi:MAG: pentapeptide repeat-containing protein [Bryobacteraceae bacterium]
MRLREPRERPKSWDENRQAIRARWAAPFHALEWIWQWTAYFLSHWAFLEVLEYLSTLSVLVAVVFYFAETGDRRKQKHYQAWQVINTAQGKGGSGGRIEALQELNLDGIPLVGVDASGAFLQGVQLEKANLLRANLESSDLRNSSFRTSNLKNADLSGADLENADLHGADLSGSKLENVDLQNANVNGFRWQKISSIKGANIRGVRNEPAGFRAWALGHKAVLIPSHGE